MTSPYRAAFKLTLLRLRMGHQAAQCTTGTINWRQMYGDVAFRIQPTVFQSDIDAIKKAREVDHAKLAEVAAAWARGLPEGWGATRDGSGKVYYWHKVTKKVQWDRPTPDTPIS
ncbi:hypothetical protein F751_2206 [Auxenochlorella protothecoides]|uniref:WW domain-containing protein n=1 Tax=Auxenochlorella protothecoides TaxID=3075 RepID=A0A087SLL5_AUXPR|nr:hypothetical protein F751_2206 [Auxenochlorella protothecoides]KFM26619.1 hypothetical protein F751_2206 [Auxenochlorella protothecoides]